MNSHELFEKFVSFLFDNHVALKPFMEENDIGSDKRKQLIEDFLDSEITVKCGYCHSEGLGSQNVYDGFGNIVRTMQTQKRCPACNGAGKISTTIRSIIELRQNMV